MLVAYSSILLLFVVNSGVRAFQGPALYQVTEPFDHSDEPIWDSRTGLLYFVDTYVGNMLSYNPRTSEVHSISVGALVTAVIPTKRNPHRFIVARNRSLLSVEWDGRHQVGAIDVLNEVSPQFPTSRFNDGKADRRGNVWIGTMGQETPTGVVPDQGILYFVNKTNIQNPLPVIQPVNISNGVAWNKANNKFYYMDTFSFVIAEYNYNNNTEQISNRRVVFDLTQHPETNGTFPDGMTIDKDDNLWIGLNFGGAVIKVNPRTGNLIQKIAVPAAVVSSVNWGGEFMDILFVTTSRHLLTPAERLQQPAAGSIFAITNLGTHGLPSNFANII